MPHAPQFAGSLVTSTQVPPQSVIAASHTHAPAVQICPPVHATLQPPQLFTSDVVSMHEPVQSTSGAVHIEPHMPRVHVSPGFGQAVPHMPQFAVSVSRSMQMPVQAVCPAGHVHVLAEQVCPPAHAIPHAPQLRSSLRVSMHPPAHIICPAGQVIAPPVHAPAEHICVALHIVVHAPQWFGSVRVFTHVPLHVV